MTTVGTMVAATISFVGGLVVFYAVPAALEGTLPDGHEFCQHYRCGIGPGLLSVLLLAGVWVLGVGAAAIATAALTRQRPGGRPPYRRAVVVGLVVGILVVLLMLGLDIALFVTGEPSQSPPQI